MASDPAPDLHTYVGPSGTERRIDYVGFSVRQCAAGGTTAEGNTWVTHDLSLSMTEKVDHRAIAASTAWPMTPAEIQSEVRGRAKRPAKLDRGKMHDPDVCEAFVGHVWERLYAMGDESLLNDDPTRCTTASSR